MLHVAVDVVVESVDLAVVVVVVTTVILEAVMVTMGDTVSHLRKEAFQSHSMRNVVYLVYMVAVVVLVVVDAVKLVKVNVLLEGHMIVVVELAEGLS